LSINGTAVTCGPLNEYGTGSCAVPPNLNKDFSVYPKSGAYLFRISAGTNAYPTNSWWGTSQACQ